MYRIVKTDNTEIGCTDTVRYIKIAANGCYVQCEQSAAIGLAYNGTAYNLFGHSEVAGADQVMVIKFDSAKFEPAQIRADVDYLAAMGGIDL